MSTQPAGASGVEVWARPRAGREAPRAASGLRISNTEPIRWPTTHEEARALKDRLEADCSVLSGRIREAQARAARTGEYMPRDDYNALLALRDQRKREVVVAHALLARLRREEAVEAREAHRSSVMTKDRLFVTVARERLPPDVFDALMTEATSRWLEEDGDE